LRPLFQHELDNFDKVLSKLFDCNSLGVGAREPGNVSVLDGFDDKLRYQKSAALRPKLLEGVAEDRGRGPAERERSRKKPRPDPGLGLFPGPGSLIGGRRGSAAARATGGL
jgi:hypothetical protein